jgi:hypothetical protein
MFCAEANGDVVGARRDLEVLYMHRPFIIRIIAMQSGHRWPNTALTGNHGINNTHSWLYLQKLLLDFNNFRRYKSSPVLIEKNDDDTG